MEYRIDPSQERAFLKALHALGHLRRRDGAFFWSVFYDPAAAGCFVETFAVETWLEHLRQHARITKADLRVEERVRSFLVEESGPKVVHLIHADLKPSRGKMPLSE